ncbi:helix-turn-helix domain-containing protein [Neobacillus drentensis]|uniref:helix-turn-helix domain-containing protein n=1 Tax=Neobacillus drentensis TaxID=220684 RepID=UPI002FFDE4D6
MLVGEIIKFYRTKAGLTQGELGTGICSSKHVSKIERGDTSYSSEILALLTERLQIDIKKEISRLKNMENQLHRWHKEITMQRMKEVEETRKELEKIPFISTSKHTAMYQLLLARYYILKNNFKNTYDILKHVQREYPDLPPYEKNLLRHVWGIYYIYNSNTSGTENHRKAIQVLIEIDKDTYGNYEYYYNLAMAYHWIDSKVRTYVYAEKALRYFKETNNFIRAIDAETLILWLDGNDIYIDFQEIIVSYHNLIQVCEILNAPDRKGTLLNNLGHIYSKRKDYVNAQKFFKEALDMMDNFSVQHLKYLYDYLKSCLEGKLLQNTMMLKKAHEGLSLAKKLDNSLFKILFKLLIYRIENKLDQYYSFIEENALPYFQSNKHLIMKNSYAKELYNHYMKIEQYEKVARISKILIDTDNEIS